MRVSKKGQITIPREIRERHGFHPGTAVRFVEEDGIVRLEKVGDGALRGRQLVGRMRGRAQTRLTTDQIMALTRGRDG